MFAEDLQKPDDLTPSYLYVAEPSQAEQVHLQGLNMLVYSRPLSQSIHRYTASLQSLAGNSECLLIEKSDLHKIDELNSRLPDSDAKKGKQLLIDDIKQMANLFFDVTKEPAAQVSLSFIDYDMCRLFHTDKLRLRLLCTYYGKGTEWLSDQNADRSGLGKGCNSKIVRKTDQIKTLKEFEVGLLKGDNHYNSNRLGVVHRSPTVEATTEPFRVLLKIDSVDF